MAAPAAAALAAAGALHGMHAGGGGIGAAAAAVAPAAPLAAPPAALPPAGENPIAIFTAFVGCIAGPILYNMAPLEHMAFLQLHANVYNRHATTGRRTNKTLRLRETHSTMCEIGVFLRDGISLGRVL